MMMHGPANLKKMEPAVNKIFYWNSALNCSTCIV